MRPGGSTRACRNRFSRFPTRRLSRPRSSVTATPNEDGTYTAELGDLVDWMDALRMNEEAFELELGPPFLRVMLSAQLGELVF